MIQSGAAKWKYPFSGLVRFQIHTEAAPAQLCCYSDAYWRKNNTPPSLFSLKEFNLFVSPFAVTHIHIAVSTLHLINLFVLSTKVLYYIFFDIWMMYFISFPKSCWGCLCSQEYHWNRCWYLFSDAFLQTAPYILYLLPMIYVLMSYVCMFTALYMHEYCWRETENSEYNCQWLLHCNCCPQSTYQVSSSESFSSLVLICCQERQCTACICSVAL